MENRVEVWLHRQKDLNTCTYFKWTFKKNSITPPPPQKKEINSNTDKLKDSQDFPSQYNTSKHESQIILKFTFNVTMYVDLISVKLLDSLVIHVGQWFG